MEPLLRTRQLCLGHPARPRLDMIDLQLERGDRLALLGVNGAGKSTLMMVLAGVLAARSGRIEIEGMDLAEAGPALRHRMGLLPQRVPVYPELTVSENLAWAGQLQGLNGAPLRDACGRTLEQVGLDGIARRLAGRLSAGMLQRLGLAQAMLHQPEILVLDEPTASLDPLQTAQIRELIGQLPGETSVILATHLLDDVQQLCTRVAVLDSGRLTTQLPVTPDMDLLQHFEQAAGVTV